MGAEDMARISEVEHIDASREPAGRNIHPDETRAILGACLAVPGPLGIRNAAMIALLHSTGMRRDEIATALIERYDPGERALRVIGKGNKERTVYVHHAAVGHLDRWLVIVGTRQGPVFRPVDKHGNIGARPLSERSVGHAVNRRHKEAGIPPISTHDFRRTFIGDLVNIATHGSPAPRRRLRPVRETSGRAS